MVDKQANDKNKKANLPSSAFGPTSDEGKLTVAVTLPSLTEACCVLSLVDSLNCFNTVKIKFRILKVT